MKTIQHKFVEFIPDIIEDGVLYISIEYCTVVHKCVCGCGNEVVTPLSPTDWEIRFDGKSISLDPSIGNWSFECKSHYFISRNKIRFARRWSDWKIEEGRFEDAQRKKEYFGSTGDNSNL
jgi:hypothetical protein